MKIIALIPYWSNYQFPVGSVKDRDTLTVGGHSLLERTIKLCNEVESVQDVVIYTSNTNVAKHIDDALDFTVIKRDLDLDNQDTSIEEIIERFLQVSDADFIVLMHPRCPFIKANTVQECITAVVNGNFDSAFVATQHKKLAWIKNKPLNYSIETNGKTPNLASVDPVMLESSAVYVFSKNLFNTKKRRIADEPFIKLVGKYEGFDIESEDDYEIADLLINAGFDK